MKNKFKKSVFLLSSLMMLSVGAGIINVAENTVNVAEAAETTVSYVFKDNGHENASAIESITFDTNVSAVFNKGSNSNAPKYYSSGYALRCYGGNFFTITTNVGTITNVDLTFGSSDGSNIITADSGTYGDGTWDGSAASVTFTIGGTSGNRRISSIEISYDTNGQIEETVEAYILFDAGEYGTCSVEDAYTEDLKYTLPEVEAIADTHNFLGWYDENDEFVGLPGETVQFNNGAEVILTAKYEEKPVAGDGEAVDELTRAFTELTANSTTYTNWTGKTGLSGAVYAGNSAAGNDSIQLRSDKSTAGVITTVSGGYARKIEVVWHSNTASARVLQVYGKNTPYSSSSDLYSTSTQGTLIGEIARSNQTELVIDGDYEYIGLRSKSGAMYLSNIYITWEKVAPSTTFDVELDANGGSFNSEIETLYTGNIGESVSVYLPKESEITVPTSPYADQGAEYKLLGWNNGIETLEPGSTKTFDSKCYIKAVYELVATVSEAIAICEYTGSTNTTYDVTVKGTITSIDTAYSSQYNNISVTISDDTGSLKVFRLSGGSELKIGDIIKVTGKLVNYNSNTPEFAAGCTYVLYERNAKMNYQYDDDTTPNAVRLIGTIINVDVTTIDSITLHFVKNDVPANKDIELYTVYESISGLEGFEKAENTYYAVYVINGVQSVLNQSLVVTMTISFNNGAEDLVATSTITLGK